LEAPSEVSVEPDWTRSNEPAEAEARRLELLRTGVLACDECPATSDCRSLGRWRAVLVDGEVAVYCPRCWAIEFE
jgi:hypothetical protein